MTRNERTRLRAGAAPAPPVAGGTPRSVGDAVVEIPSGCLSVVKSQTRRDAGTASARGRGRFNAASQRRPLTALRRRLAGVFALFAVAPIAVTAQDDPPTRSLIVIVGAAGEPEYAESFSAWADRWKTAADTAGIDATFIGGDEDTDGVTDLDRLAAVIMAAAERRTSELWIVLIGHGTFDGQTARFNLTGPDLTAGELSKMLTAVDAPTAVINCASASAPFINAVSAPNRVVITATKSGTEQNATRFGDHLSAVLGSEEADLDKDGQTSLLEAFVAATTRTEASYVEAKQLATEHALIDDNADARGTPATWFDGVRIDPSQVTSGQVDGALARDFVLIPATDAAPLTSKELETRRQLEARLERLRADRPTPPTDEYLQQLEAVLLPLARIYEAAEKRAENSTDDP